MIHTSELDWFKSSYSSSSDINDCVEVAAAPGVMHVRDSKCVAGPQLAVGGGAWAGFVSYASEG
ncbi:DUF397 domain-containing protein [Streptomyces sp. NPDC051567]|uniref:DUF397 domain-containing protein n=1 Tax=Streptomyces sp. NPDC051567 TaxID=3365660 RepID=UPI0037966AFB